MLCNFIIIITVVFYYSRVLFLSTGNKDFMISFLTEMSFRYLSSVLV